jgi:hypothetical protein
MDKLDSAYYTLRRGKSNLLQGSALMSPICRLDECRLSRLLIYQTTECVGCYQVVGRRRWCSSWRNGTHLTQTGNRRIDVSFSFSVLQRLLLVLSGCWGSTIYTMYEVQNRALGPLYHFLQSAAPPLPSALRPWPNREVGDGEIAMNSIILTRARTRLPRM